MAVAAVVVGVGVGGGRVPDKPRLRPEVAVAPKAPTVKAPVKTADPEMAALIIRSLDRYARDVQDKSELDKRVDQALSGDPSNRKAAIRLLANFRRLALSRRQAVLGKWANILTEPKITDAQYRSVFQRNERPRLKPAAAREPARARPNLTPKHSRSQSPNDEDENGKPGPGGQSLLPSDPQPSFVRLAGGAALRYQLYYNGMWCHYETDSDAWLDGDSDSDEIYVIITVVQANGTTTTTKFPQRHDPPYYWDVDDGEYRPRSANTITRIWGGANGRTAQDVFVSVQVWDRDNGNAEDAERAAVTAEHNPLIAVVALAAAGVVEAVVDLMGGEDDLVEVKNQQVTARQMEDWVQAGMRTFRREDRPCHFRTIHNGSGNTEGADYHVYFAFHSPLALE
jgi:hypothetical protein